MGKRSLTSSTVIMFWIPRSLPYMPAFTTNVEFGYWLHSGKVIYGRHNDVSKIKYLDWLYKEDCKKEQIINLDELLKESVLLSNTLYEGKTFEILPLSERKFLKKK